MFALLLLIGTHGFTQTTNNAPPELRSATFSCDKATLQTALDLKHAGWTYHMPEPKSPQAAWGNPDGRTTWWIGYWTNRKNSSTSEAQPTRDDSGKFVGDGNGSRRWRRGGSPGLPKKIEWLCSEDGGIEPH